MFRYMFAAGFLALASLGLTAAPERAHAQQHWFFGNYGGYDEEAYYAQPRQRPRRQHWAPFYPRPWFWRGVPEREEIIEYQTAPGQWVRIYPDGSQEIFSRRPRREALPERYRKPKNVPFVARKVPLPKAKPTIASRTLEPADSALRSLEAEAAEEPPLAEALEGPVVDRMQTGSLKAVSCDDARRIVADFGFSDVKAKTCSGKTYDIEATRDGTPYAIKLSAADGELTEVKKR